MPKASEAGVTESTGLAAAVPLPVAVTVGFPPLLETVIVALLAPLVPGLKTTVKVWLPPAATVKGVAGAVTEKSVESLFVMPVTFTLEEPVFDMVTVWAAELVPID